MKKLDIQAVIVTALISIVLVAVIKRVGPSVPVVRSLVAWL